MPNQPTMPRRPAIRWHECLQMAAIITVAIAALATLIVRERIARIPEPGRATPIEELRAAWAEAEREYPGTPEPKKEDPITMPQPKTERCP